MCNTQNSLLLNQHHRDDAPQNCCGPFGAPRYRSQLFWKLFAFCQLKQLNRCLCNTGIFFCFIVFDATAPQWARASSFTRFLDHTRRTTVGRTPLDEWSARRRDLYLTTHNTHNIQTSMPPAGFEPTISAGERPQTYTLDRAAIGTGLNVRSVVKFGKIDRWGLWHLWGRR